MWWHLWRLYFSILVWNSKKHVLRRGFGRGFTLGPSFGKIVGDFVSEDSLMPRNPDKGERCGKFEEVESFEEIFGKFLVASGFPAAFGDVDCGCAVDEEDDWEEWWVCEEVLSRLQEGHVVVGMTKRERAVRG